MSNAFDEAYAKYSALLEELNNPKINQGRSELFRQLIRQLAILEKIVEKNRLDHRNRDVTG